MVLSEILKNLYDSKMSEFDARIILCKPQDSYENPEDYYLEFFNEPLETVSLSSIVDFLQAEVLDNFFIFNELNNTTYHYFVIDI